MVNRFDGSNHSATSDLDAMAVLLAQFAERSEH
jgi:hypothetical protein